MERSFDPQGGMCLGLQLRTTVVEESIIIFPVLEALASSPVYKTKPKDNTNGKNNTLNGHRDIWEGGYSVWILLVSLKGWSTILASP